MKAKEREALLQALQARFEEHAADIGASKWADVLARLEANPDALGSLQKWRPRAGKPDVIGKRFRWIHLLRLLG